MSIHQTSIPEAETAVEAAKAVHATAQAQVESAINAVKSAEQLAGESAAAFKAKPTSKTHSDSAIACQLLENAREVHRNASLAEQGARVDVQRATARLEALRAAASVATYEQDLSDKVRALLEADKAIRQTIADIRARNEQQRSDLRAMTGAGMTPNSRLISEDELRARVRAELAARYGTTAAFLGQVEAVHSWLAVC